jgi:hypothetical protein
MSFFSTEELHAVMPAEGADRGGRSAPEAESVSPEMAAYEEMGARLDHRQKASSMHLPSSV